MPVAPIDDGYHDTRHVLIALFEISRVLILGDVHRSDRRGVIADLHRTRPRLPGVGLSELDGAVHALVVEQTREEVARGEDAQRLRSLQVCAFRTAELALRA